MRRLVITYITIWTVVYKRRYLQYAQQKSSIYNIARTYGLKIPGNRPSIALLDVSITVPAFGDQEDSRYLGIIRSGSQFIGAGQIFENPRRY